MSEKSHVGMGHEICPICGTKHTESVLLDKRLRNVLEREQVTGHSLCPEHQKLHEEGFLAIMEIDPEQSDNEAVFRTGRLLHMKREVAEQMFEGQDVSIPAIYTDIQSFQGIVDMVNVSTKAKH